MTSDQPPAPADALVIEVFTTATVTAFEELCQTPVIAGEPYITPSGPLADWVTAEITLRRAIPGRLVLAFPLPVLEVLVRQYISNEGLIPLDLAEDTAGEFANVIAGQAKTMLKGTHYHFNLSTPRLGQIGPTTDVMELLALPFTSAPGSFVVCVHLPPCEDFLLTL